MFSLALYFATDRLVWQTHVTLLQDLRRAASTAAEVWRWSTACQACLSADTKRKRDWMGASLSSAVWSDLTDGVMQVSTAFELYIALAPLLPKNAAVGAAHAVIRWVRTIAVLMHPQLMSSFVDQVERKRAVSHQRAFILALESLHCCYFSWSAFRYLMHDCNRVVTRRRELRL